MMTKTQMSGKKVLTACAAVLCALTLIVSILAANNLGKTKINVTDGAHSLSFRTTSTQLDDILTEAAARGVAPLDKEDFAEYNAETGDLMISRRISVAITDGDSTLYTQALSSSNVGTILEENGIQQDKGCFTHPAADAYVTDGQIIRVGHLSLDRSAYEPRDVAYLTDSDKRTIVFSASHGIYHVNLSVNGKVSFLEIEPGTSVKNILEGQNVELRPGDVMDVDLSEIVYEDMNIIIKKAVTATVSADGFTTEVSMYGGTVQDALDQAIVKLGADDVVNYDTDAELEDGAEIVVKRVTFEERTEIEEVAYETEIVHDSSMFVGQSYKARAGALGTQTVTYRDRYEDGVFVSSEAIANHVITAPTSELIHEGTRTKKAVKSVGGPGYATDASGNSFSYSTVYTGSGTAYYGGGTTSIGLKAQVGVVAVDPTIIPYGTRMYIVSCDGQIVYGYCIAGDTGGFANDGAAIADLYYDTYDDCVRFGRRDVYVYILD